MSTRLDRLWLSVVAFLLVSLACGGILLVLEQRRHQPVEISLSSSSPPQYQEEIYVGGTVANPGFYPAKEGDTLQNLIQAAGIASKSDLSRVKIYVPEVGERHPEQRINLNKAEAWLLDALPGIGQTRAQAIVDYRNQHGPFQRTEALLKVQGIGDATFDTIRGLITVED